MFAESGELQSPLCKGDKMHMAADTAGFSLHHLVYLANWCLPVHSLPFVSCKREKCNKRGNVSTPIIPLPTLNLFLYALDRRLSNHTRPCELGMCWHKNAMANADECCHRSFINPRGRPFCPPPESYWSQVSISSKWQFSQLADLVCVINL